VADTIIVPRAVCDTSVLVPPALRRHLQNEAVADHFVPLWSPWIIGELYRVLAWRWAKKHGTSNAAHKACSQAADTMMAILLADWVLVDIKPPWSPAWPALEDPNDIPIWATAVAGHAQYVVSENTSDFPPADVQGRHIWQDIEYIQAQPFLEKIAINTP
jgi:predicted nucleic acid-binding protein